MKDRNLKSTIIHLKSLDQHFDEPIVAGAGNVNGRSIIVKLEQETLKQMATGTMLYLNWKHLQTGIRGYNVFIPLNEEKTGWEFKYPRAMLVEGDIICCIDLIDDISVCSTSSFNVKVLSNPNEGFDYTKYSEFNDFQKSLLELARLNGTLQIQLDEAKLDYQKMEEKLKKIEERLAIEP